MAEQQQHLEQGIPEPHDVTGGENPIDPPTGDSLPPEPAHGRAPDEQEQTSVTEESDLDIPTPQRESSHTANSEVVFDSNSSIVVQVQALQNPEGDTSMNDSAAGDSLQSEVALKNIKLELTDCMAGTSDDIPSNQTAEPNRIVKKEPLDSASRHSVRTRKEKPVQYDSLNHNEALCNFAVILRDENKLMDISLVCAGEVIMAHRLVLVAHSKTLYSIIGADEDCRVISLDHLSISANVMHVILDFIYCGTIQLRPQEKLEVLEAARALEITQLVELLDPAPIKRKRGRPRKYSTSDLTPVSATSSRVKKAKIATAKRLLSAKSKKPVLAAVPGQKKKRGRPRKVEQPVKVEVEDDFPATLDDDVDADDDYVPEADDVMDIGVDIPPVVDDNDEDFKPVTPTAKRKVKKNTKSPKVSKEKSPKKILTPEEEEKRKIMLEQRRNRPKPIKTDDGMFKCPIEGCDYIKNTDSFIYIHIRNHSDERPYPCPTCDKRFKMKKHLDVHIRVHTGERPYPCEICGKRFKATKHRNRHRRVHTGEKIGFCEECGKGFSSHHQLNRHIMAVHRKERPHKCEHPGCKYAAADKSTLRQHMLQHTRDPDNPDANKDILCETCGKGFLSANSLRLHRLSHTGEDMVCPDCDYVTKYKSAMESHLMRRHGKTKDGKLAEKRWRCDQCVYACFTESEFNLHMMKHRGEKPYKCPVCDFATHDKGTLKKHARLHTGEMPFVCPNCPKSFTSQSGLARHKRTHTGYKPHKCDECDKAYADKKSLVAHKFTHLNVKPFECHMCVYACVKKEYLLKHIQKTHGDHNVPDVLRPNPENKKYRPKCYVPGGRSEERELDIEEEEGRVEGVNVIVEETHPEPGCIGSFGRSQQQVTYTTVSDIAAVQGLVEGYQGQQVFTLSHYTGN